MKPPPRGNRKRRAGNRPIACVDHQPTYEPSCRQCHNLLEMILRARGELGELDE